jgi:hypothetical protein
VWVLCLPVIVHENGRVPRRIGTIHLPSSQIMGNFPDIFSQSLSVYPSSPLLFHETAAHLDLKMDKSMSAAKLDPYLHNLPAYLSAGSNEVESTSNDAEILSEHGNWDGRYIEQCCADRCFFGCRNHAFQHGTEGASVHPATHSSAYLEFKRQGYGGSNGFDFANFSNAKHCSNQAGDHPRRMESPSALETLPHVLPNSLSHGLGYHSRHASVPSSPTLTVPLRQRRMSEPFNSIMNRHHAQDGVIVRSLGGSDFSLYFNGPGRSRDPKPILFKTELCRSWEEKGFCRYGYVRYYERISINPMIN